MSRRQVSGGKAHVVAAKNTHTFGTGGGSGDGVGLECVWPGEAGP